MESYNELIKNKKIPQLFVFGMYRSGTTVIARSLAGESKIAFASDPIRPFFNWYRTAIQKEISVENFDNNLLPLGDYFKTEKNYIKKLIKSNFSENITSSELTKLRNQIIKEGSPYSPKFISNLKKKEKFVSSNFSDELKHYLSIIISTYGNKNSRLVGLKEVWSIEMALPILNMIGNNAKILVVFRDPLDIVSSSISGKSNYSILSLVSQWRKQVVFYNFLKIRYPNQVDSINYEDFCSRPTFTLKKKLQSLFNISEFSFSDDLRPLDDSGNFWMKNSSYNNEQVSSNIDFKSVGKYKKVLNNSEIEWVNYLTHMSSYTKYNKTCDYPIKPKSFFPKRDIVNVADWAKLEILKLEKFNLEEELKNEHKRVEMMLSSIKNKKSDINYLTNQI